MKTYFKYSVILIVAVLLFMVWRGCSNSGNGKKSNDTISVKVDTVWIASKSDTFYKPNVVKTVYKERIKFKTDTLETFEFIAIDTVMLFKDYFAVNYYEDSVKVKYGTLYINDTVTENKIASRGVKTNFNIPVVKEIVTLKRAPKNIAFIGLGAMASTESFLQQTELSFGMKFKNDKYYGVKAAISREGYLLFGGNFMFPIRLNKK